MTTTIASIELGRGTVTGSLKFIGEVSGGGANGPGLVSRCTDYLSTVRERFDEDNRSGSKRSGSCMWQLAADQLYQIDNVAVSSSRSGTFYLSTRRGVPVELTRAEFDAERARLWPMGKQLAVEAAERRRQEEAARIVRDAERAEARRIEQEALAELNAEKGAEIAENGQEVVEGMPELTGTPKQIAYALNIRAAYAAKFPEDTRAIKTATTAKYWIENHRSVLFNR